MHFLAGWDLIAGELTTAAHPVPEPSVLSRSVHVPAESILALAGSACTQDLHAGKAEANEAAI